MTSSCSFRITRTAEDLAQMITALSQRLVKLEQRQESLELQYRQLQEDTPPEQLEMLDGVEQLLRECQELLQNSEHTHDSEGELITEEDAEALAA